MQRWAFAVSTIVGLSATVAQATDVSIIANKDNTIYQTGIAQDTSNGAGVYLFVGATQNLSLRRALIGFDLSSIPAGATVQAASIQLFPNRGLAIDSPVSLHRVSAAWGEGASNAGEPGGSGTESQTGDASWNYRFFNTAPWTNVGGDFGASPSSTSVVVGPGEVLTFDSTVTLVADVQAFVNNSASNFGWIILGDEETPGSAYRFDSRESSLATKRPTLHVTYTVGNNCPADLNNDGSVGLSDLATLLTNFGAPGTAAQGDLNNDGQVSLTDLAQMLTVFGSNCQ